MNATQLLFFTFEVMSANTASLEEDHDESMSSEASSEDAVATRGGFVRGTVLPAYGNSRATKATCDDRGYSYDDTPGKKRMQFRAIV
jgi:hypothetical protein